MEHILRDRMQRRIWLDRRLGKHFHEHKPHVVRQDPSSVRRQQKRLQSSVRRKTAAMLMECLSFAFYVARLQDASQTCTAVSDDNIGEWEEGVARPVPEPEEAVLVVSPSELVVSTGVSKVLRHYLPLAVHRKTSEAQDEALQ